MRSLQSQMALSRAFDKLLPPIYRVDGNRDYCQSFLPKYIKKGMTIYDIGGGKNPYVSIELKKALNLSVVGIDIDKYQLELAPDGIYDKMICADICSYRYNGVGVADLVICQALLEHVPSTESAFKAISSVLKPNGLAVLFVPSRDAVYARLNILLPQHFKKWILHSIYPQTKRNQGFISFYNRCTPKDFREIAVDNGLEVVEQKVYFMSSYFSFFFPLYLFWRLWIVGFHYLAGEQAAETFCMALRKIP